MGGGEIVRYLSRYGAGRIAKVALIAIEIIARAAAAGIAQATLIEYRDASHGILVTEQERVTTDLLAFLAA